MAWMYIKEGAFLNEELGPFKDQQVTSLIAQGTVKKSTAVLHPSHTSGQWINAFDAGPRRKVFTKIDEAASERKRQEQGSTPAEKAVESYHKAEALRAANEQLRQERLLRLEANRQKATHEDLSGKPSVSVSFLIGATFSAHIVVMAIGVPLRISLLSQAKSAPQEASIAAIACAFFGGCLLRGEECREDC